VTADAFGIVGTLQAGAFQVEQVVAEGGFAVVYRAHHVAFRAAVALKCLKVPSALTAEQQREFLERFREEAELLFRLSAGIPSVVRPLHVGTLETPTRAFVPFLALEWLDGKTLEQSIAERRAQGRAPMNLVDLVRLLTPVARALERAHHFPDAGGELAILHRDLKPENIFVASIQGAEVVKILDFGIGKVKNAATQIVGKISATEDMLSAFTPGYGAPEQWLPKRFGQTGPWTDVWGVALTLLEGCSGQPAFTGDHGAILAAVVDEANRPTPAARGVLVRADVDSVFRRALAVDPRHRYPSIEAFWSDLVGALGAAATEWMPVSRRGQSPAVPDLVLDQKPGPSRAPAPRPNLARPSFDDDYDFQLGAQLPPKAPRPSPIALDGVGLTSVPPSRQARAVARTIGARPRRSEAVSLRTKLREPIQCIVAGCLVMIADYVFTAVNGEPFALGPVRAFWIAAPLVIGGVGLAVVRLFANDD
jgi:eukaryotic-like serine/threonine-protein kinase